MWYRRNSNETPMSSQLVMKPYINIFFTKSILPIMRKGSVS